MHTYTHIQAHIHTNTTFRRRSTDNSLAKPKAHTSTHACTHTATHARRYTRIQAHIQTHILADTHIYKHTCKTHIHAQTRNFSMRTKINFAERGFIIKTLFCGFFFCCVHYSHSVYASMIASIPFCVHTYLCPCLCLHLSVSIPLRVSAILLYVCRWSIRIHYTADESQFYLSADNNHIPTRASLSAKFSIVPAIGDKYCLIASQLSYDIALRA